MRTNYQLVTLGDKHPLLVDIIKMFKEKVNDLGLPADSLQLIDKSNFNSDFRNNAPGVCLYFSSSKHGGDLDTLQKLIDESAFILPVVATLENFTSQVPNVLEGINGFELKNGLDVPALVNNLME